MGEREEEGKLNTSLLMFFMDKEYRRQALDLKQMCLPPARRRKCKGVLLPNKGKEGRTISKTKVQNA